jgi:hypothetical protein
MSRITTKKTQKDMKMTTVAKKSKQDKNSNTISILPVTWTATELGPHKRWWWYIGFCIIMLWLTILLAMLRDWLLFALATVATITILVTYARAPRQMTYRLDEQALTINKQTLQLDNYRAFTIETVRAVADDTQPVAVLLLSKRRLGFPYQIALPENAEETVKVLDAFGEVLPFDNAKGYLSRLNFLDRLAHWLRLN